MLGGGPSLTQAQIDYCRDKAYVIAINNAYALARWADIVYFADARWYRWHTESPVFRAITVPLVTIENVQLHAVDKRVQSLQMGRARDLSEQRDTLNTGSNGGFQAINFAYLAGATRIILLGFDMQANADGALNWHTEHKVRGTQHVYKNIMAPRFATALPQLQRAGVGVINATPDSALKCFRNEDLAKCL